MNHKVCNIRLETDGFSRWLEEKQIFRIRWDQIDRIIAYKDDLFAYDSICLGFYIDGDTERYRFVDEEMQGWSELTRQLDETFRVGHQWYLDIMNPAFERCERTLWAKKMAPKT